MDEEEEEKPKKKAPAKKEKPASKAKPEPTKRKAGAEPKKAAPKKKASSTSSFTSQAAHIVFVFFRLSMKMQRWKMFLALQLVETKKKRKIVVGRNARYFFLPSSLLFPSFLRFFLPPTGLTNKHDLPARTGIQDLRQTTGEEVETGVKSQEEQGDYR